MRYLFFAIPVLSCSLIAASAQPANAVSGKIVEYGIFTAKTISKEKEKSTAAGTVSTIDKIVHVKTTKNIPGRLNTRFGFRCKIGGSNTGAAIVATKKNIFPKPGLRKSKTGKLFVTGSYNTSLDVGDTTYIGYHFEQPWEIVVGKWTQQLWYKDKLLCGITFRILPN